MFWMFFLMLIVGLFIVYPYVLFKRFHDMASERRVIDVREVAPNADVVATKEFPEEERMLIHPSE